MLNPNKYNIYKYFFVAFIILSGLSLVVLILKQQETGLAKAVVIGVMSAALVMFALSLLTWITKSLSPKNVKRSMQVEAQELLDIIVNSKVGHLLTNAPKDVAVRITELIDDLDVPEQPKCKDRLDKLYELAPACALPRKHGEIDGCFLDWYQYDLCIIAAKEDIELANKIKKELLHQHPGCRIYLDVADVSCLREESSIKKVFYANSWKCVALLSHHTLNQTERKEELNYAMQRDGYVDEERCKNYLTPIPLDKIGLNHMKTERFLSKYAKRIKIVEDQDELSKAIVDKLSKFIKRATHYDHMADSIMKNYEDGETIPPLKRFAVALSFPNERQIIAQAVVDELEKLIPDEEIFYYPKLVPELSGANLPAKLQSYYRTHSELVVVFLCAEYANSQWCKREWWAIRKLLHQQSHKLMLLRFDKAHIPKLPPTQGYVDCEQLIPGEIAELIVQRLALNRQQQ